MPGNATKCNRAMAYMDSLADCQKLNSDFLALDGAAARIL